MSKPEAPTPPDPTRTAAAQTGTNVSTAIANAFLGNVGQITPEGELRYDPTSNYSWTDPTTGSTYNIPTFTATQIRSPAQQAIADQQNAAKFNLAGLASSQSGRISNLLSDNIDVSQAGQRGDASLVAGVPLAATSFADVAPQLTDYASAGPIATTYGGQGDYQRGFGDVGGVVRDYGPNDFSADRSRIEQSLFERLQPQLDRQRNQLEQRLADQGIRYGSPAYSAAMDDFNRQLTDTRLAITAQGGQEQKLQADLAAQRAGFANAAQQQAYQQAQGRGTFANAAQQAAAAEAQQRGAFANQAQQSLAEQLANRAAFSNAARQTAFQQAATRGQFSNQGLAAQVAQRQAVIAAQNDARARYFQEQFALRNQPINEISALLSQGQVSQPQWIGTQQTQIPTTDVAGLINQNFAQQFGNYQTQQTAQNQLLGGILGFGSNIVGSYLRSDRRAKDDIHRIGTVFASAPDNDNRELPIYRYSYKDDPADTPHVGPMAQDVERIDPDAVRSIGGMKHIHTDRLMGSILRAA